MNFEKKIPIDTEAWNSFRLGDKNSFSAIYEKYFSNLYNYGNKFTRDTDLIEDSIQDLFIKLWQNRATINETESVKNYLFKSLRNTLFSKLNHREFIDLNYETIEEMGFNLELSYEAFLIEDESNLHLKNKIAQSLEKLTDRQKEAVFLRFYEGFSYQEVAKLMLITIKALYKIIARAIERLKLILKTNNFFLSISFVTLIFNFFRY